WLIPGQSYMESLLIVVICGAVGGIVYLLFVLTSGLASHILGDRIQRLPVLGKLIK
ncbi:polysaccharide biosynthesis protein, partial [Bacillus wiedmannii]